MSDHDYCQYYVRQCGGALPHYQGARYQKGHGIGSLLAGAFRKARTLLPSVAKGTVKGLIADKIKGVPKGTSLRNRLFQAGRFMGHNLVDDALMQAMNRPSGGIKRPAQSGGGRSRPARKKARRTKGRTTRGGDIFD